MGSGQRRSGGLLLRGETPVRDNMFIPILLNGVIEDHYWSYSLIPVYENGRIAGVYDAYRNTTEIVMGARRLRESEARLKLATEVAKLGVFVWHTAEDRASWENDRMYEIFGRTREDGPVNGTAFMNEVVHPDYREAFRQAMEATLQKGERFHFEGIDLSSGQDAALDRGQRATSTAVGWIARTDPRHDTGHHADQGE